MKLNQGTLTLVLAAIYLWIPDASWAYGGGASKRVQSCVAPRIYELQPAQDSVVASLKDVSMSVSKEAKKPSITLKINGETVPATIAETGGGNFSVRASLDSEISEPGFITISVAAVDVTEKCPKRLVYRVQVGPEAGAEGKEKSAGE